MAVTRLSGRCLLSGDTGAGFDRAFSREARGSGAQGTSTRPLYVVGSA
jgi:hypothetical protein